MSCAEAHVTLVVVCLQEWLGKSAKEGADTRAKVVVDRVQDVSVEARVEHELGDIRALPGEDSLRGGMIEVPDGLA